MAQAQGGLREVVNDRKNERVRGEGNEEGIAENQQANERRYDAYKYKDIPGKNERHQGRAGMKKITLRRFGSEPGGKNSAAEELCSEAGMSADKEPGLLPFFIEKCGLAKLGVAADLFESGDAIHGSGMLVVDLVVAHPQFKCKVGAQRNQSMELDGVAHGPGETDGHENRDCQR